MTGSPAALDLQALRRDLTQALAEAIAQTARATEAQLRAHLDRYEALLAAARAVAGEPLRPPAAPPISRPRVIVVDPTHGRSWEAREYEVIEVARDALQALAHAQELHPDAIIYNLPVYAYSDVSAIAELSAVGVALRVIVMVDAEGDRRRLAVLRRPRITLLPRNADHVALAAALGVTVSERGPRDGQREGDGLTAREMEVLHLMAAGKANKQIAADLGVSIATAKYHVANILRKLDAANRAQALVRAYEQGLLLR